MCYANKAGIEDRKIKAVVVFSYKKRKAKQKNIEEGRETLAVRQSDRQTNNNGSSVLIFGLESNTCLGGEYLSREIISRRHSELELCSEVRIGHCNGDNHSRKKKERKKHTTFCNTSTASALTRASEFSSSSSHQNAAGMVIIF